MKIMKYFEKKPLNLFVQCVGPGVCCDLIISIFSQIAVKLTELKSLWFSVYLVVVANWNESEMGQI